LNRGGNRQLNWALHYIALVQSRFSPEAKSYLARKREAGKSHKEAMRCLKRQLSNVVFRHLVADARSLEQLALQYRRPGYGPEIVGANHLQTRGGKWSEQGFQRHETVDSVVRCVGSVVAGEELLGWCSEHVDPDAEPMGVRVEVFTPHDLETDRAIAVAIDGTDG
jgi:hypothetical protein